MIRVVIVDDQLLVRAGLTMLCDAVADIEVVGEADNGQAAISVVESVVPDVILMDLHMPGMDGIRATETILRQRPLARVLILTTFDDDDHVYPALSAGACGFLAKDATPDELVDAIRRAAVGESPFSATVLTRLVSRAVSSRGHEKTEVQPEVKLSGREAEVLGLVREGASNSSISDILNVGVTTVKTHVANLMMKTDTANRVQLAVYANERSRRDSS